MAMTPLLFAQHHPKASTVAINKTCIVGDMVDSCWIEECWHCLDRLWLKCKSKGFCGTPEVDTGTCGN